MQNVPAEVLHLILGYLDCYDDKVALQNLRRTCRTLSNAAAIHLFKAIYVWLERDSLQKLLSCSEHPIFSQCITQVTIGPGRLNPYEYNQFLPMGGERPIPFMWSARDVQQLYQWASSSPSYGQFEERIIRAKRLVEHLEYQKRMEKDGLDLALLARSMKRLPKLSTVAFDYDYRSADARALYWEGFTVGDPGVEWRRHVVQVGLQALAEAGCKPRAILLNTHRKSDGYTRLPEADSKRVHPDDGDSNGDRPDDGDLNGDHPDDEDSYSDCGLIPPWAFNDLDLLIPDTRLCSLVQGLRIFQFDGMLEEDSDFDHLLLTGALGQFLGKAQQLEEIRLSNLTAFGLNPFPALFGQAVFRRLRTVMFNDTQFNLGYFADWLLAHSASLEEIHLEHVCIDEGQWDTFLDLMRTKSWPYLSFIKLLEVMADEPTGDTEYWDWEFGPIPLVKYVRKETEGNPYHVFHPGWFPELFESV